MQTDISNFKADALKPSDKATRELINNVIDIYRLHAGIKPFDESFESSYPFLNMCYGVVSMAKDEHGDNLPKVTELALEILEEEYDQDIWQLFVANVLCMGMNEHLKTQKIIKILRQQELEEAMAQQLEQAQR